METEKLYYEDSYMKTFQASVQSCEPYKDGYKVVLNRTAFFPEGGGQYADTGRLNGAVVTDVQEKDGVIFHMTEAAFEVGCEVTGELDWEERFFKMQQHTGEHIVSGLINSTFGYDNVGFHLGNEEVTMDFNGVITKEQLLQIEWKANEAVVRNLKTEVSYPSKVELSDLRYRSKIEIEGVVRIVTISGYDVCACCAPHVARTGEIGMIKLTGIRNYKGGVRVSMRCGFRALLDYREKETSVKAVSRSLSAKEHTIVEAVEHVKDEVISLKGKLAAAKREVFRQKVDGIEGNQTCVCMFEEDLDGGEIRELANMLMERGVCICGVFTGNDVDGYHYVIGSKTEDVRETGNVLNARFDGRGGGKPGMVQGSLKGNKADIEKVFANHYPNQKGAV